MKKLIILFIITVSLNTLILSQPHRMKRDEQRHRSKIEELEKIKLIEILDMDEETTLIFFTRQKDHKKENRALMMQRDSLIVRFEEELSEREISDDAVYKRKVNEIFDLESQIMENRKKFIYSLSDILTQEQIARLVVFDFRFKREIRDIIMKERRFRNQK
jgi:hypothetical protein